MEVIGLQLIIRKLTDEAMIFPGYFYIYPTVQCNVILVKESLLLLNVIWSRISVQVVNACLWFPNIVLFNIGYSTSTDKT